MGNDDDRAKPANPGAPTALPEVKGGRPGLEATLAAGTRDAARALGSVIRPPRPLETTVAAESSPAISVPLAQVDRYILQRKLGAGGMGVVYAAHDSELGRDVAIKMIKSGASADRLRREAQALARLDHKNVVTVYDVGEHDGNAFVVMELIDGWNLNGWLHTAERSTEDILRVMMDAADGIIAAHEAGLIHRDLKPDNIFVARDGKVMVGDFGLALDADENDGVAFPTDIAAHSLTMTGHVLGTPAYMSPEQSVGESTAASDQFAFCVTVYEALFATRPFPGSTFDQILDRVDAAAIEPPKRMRRVSASVMSALRRGLSADPAARFASMRELISAMNVHEKLADAVVTFDDFVVVDADGVETRLVARIARPERDNGAWMCPIEIDGLQPQTRIGGETAFQALSLALTFVRRRFIHLVQSGARIYFADTTEREESLNEVAIRALLGEH